MVVESFLHSVLMCSLTFRIIMGGEGRTLESAACLVWLYLIYQILTVKEGGRLVEGSVLDGEKRQGSASPQDKASGNALTFLKYIVN